MASGCTRGTQRNVLRNFRIGVFRFKRDLGGGCLFIWGVGVAVGKLKWTVTEAVFAALLFGCTNPRRFRIYGQVHRRGEDWRDVPS